MERHYILKVGQAGKQAYDLGAGIVQGVVWALIWYVCGFSLQGFGMACNFDGTDWYFEVWFDDTPYTQAQMTALDAFMNGPNNTVIGLYPPKLLSPAITFVKTAYSIEELGIIASDLVGRGVGRQALFYNGNDLEIWTDSVLSAGAKNQVANMWKDRLIDASTGKPL